MPLLQLFAEGFVVGTVFFEHCVEARRVVVVHGVGEFVHDDVVGDGGREEDEAPVEVKIVVAGAAAPAGFLGANGDVAVVGVHGGGEDCGAGSQVVLYSPPEEKLYCFFCRFFR